MKSWLLLTLFLFPLLAISAESTEDSQTAAKFCKEWSERIKTISEEGCLSLKLKTSAFESINGRPLVHKEFLPLNGFKDHLPQGKILFISGIHGDEYTAISIGYLWMRLLQQHADYTRHHWLFLPLANPDGLFDFQPAIRMNANQVDLNRNFPSSDWEEKSLRFWKQHYRKDPRRFPGNHPATEPETKWMLHMIERFQPDAIISVHAPYGLLDYDGPEHAQPDQVGNLKLKSLGTFPGSLGRYAGEDLNIPVMTVELKSSRKMPRRSDVYSMWQDIENWSQLKINERSHQDFWE